MYKISDKVIKFITEVMKNWKVELTAGGKTVAGVKMPRAIFQGDVLSLLLFIIAMMPLYYILRNYTGGYKFTKSQEKISHIVYMDNIKLFGKNEKERETLIQTIRIYSQDIGKNLAYKNKSSSY